MNDSERLVTDFSPNSADLGWRVVNDSVMGGRSVGDFVIENETLVFSGRTNTNGGGFSSVRSRSALLSLAGYQGIRLRVLGDGRRYTWRLRTDARWQGRQISFSADFKTEAGEWLTVELPFTDFAAGFRGYALDYPPPDPEKIVGMGLILYDQLDGPFQLQLDSVHAY